MSPHEDPQLEEHARTIARRLKTVCENVGRKTNRNIGFMLMLYDHGEGGFLSYMSNSRREDVLETLREFIDKADRGEV